MKKALINATHYLFWLPLTVLFIMTSGCTAETENVQNSHQNKASVVMAKHDTKKPTPPKMDIHTAVVSNNIEAIQQHIQAGRDLNQKDPFGGSSPLISAALFGHKDIVSLLLKAGADIDFQNNDGSTALHVAAFFCRPEIVQLLMDHGADQHIKNNYGNTALETVSGSFAEVKPVYDMVGQSLAHMGLVLDYDHLKETRPLVAALLKSAQ